ncbi:DUF3014 domain-containing protein [Vitiosangium sp. GDMCC 1.1324]|uniref:DUF3014 domain-containing protein n=1 Tax=Vitiosangium sp. (strain GDMCC 1.1324) TaxID=2138576 RepID=UPI000D3ACE79|nr:DUF3014 domain-containing protein [Vitiosangium sp. GDMCC 1.1324]PTL79320.1 DUF3014 domain-containing protein [Vitiosangium sp. GDMCC 1.1324]
MSDPQPLQPREGAPAGAPKPASSRTPVLITVVAVVAILAIGGYALLRGGEEPAAPPAMPPAQPVVEAPGPSTDQASVTSAQRMPPLGQSDTRVRELVGLLSPEPTLQKWLSSTEDLVRRFSSAVGNIAEGESPRAALAFMAPQGAFQVVEHDGRTVIAPDSFTRYDSVARVITSLDTQTSAMTYKALKPLIDEAYKEISRPGQRFDQTLARAIQRMLDTPVPEGDIEVLDTPGVNYAYAAPELEQLSAAQKHLLRMGPANARAIQAKLRELRNALALPTASR